MKKLWLLILMALAPVVSFGQQFSPQEIAQIRALLGQPNSVSRDMIQANAVTLTKVNQDSLSSTFALRSWVAEQIGSITTGFITSDQVSDFESDPVWSSEKAGYATISWVTGLGAVTLPEVRTEVYGTNVPADLYSGVLTNVVGSTTNLFRVYKGLIYQP